MKHKFFLHTINEIWDEDCYIHISGEYCVVRNPDNKKLVKRKIHISNVNYKGKKAEYIKVGCIKYFFT